MSLVIISASQRKHSQSAKIAQYIAQLSTQYKNVSHVELCQFNLPLWDGEQASKLKKVSDWALISQQLTAATAIVLITPEWGGMASPLLKNFLLMCSSEETAHKPALIVSVSSGISGAYPIAELRMNAFKNNKLVAIPDHIIIRSVEEVLNSPQSNSPSLSDNHQHITERLAYSLHTLYEYSEALSTLRTRFAVDPDITPSKYPYGM